MDILTLLTDHRGRIMEMMLVYVVLAVLVSETWSREKGNNLTNETFNASAPRVYVLLHSSVKQGKDANLTCGDKTPDKMLYVIWELNMTNKFCNIGFENNRKNQDNCQDGKSLRNTSMGQPYLHIPVFSFTDVGLYTCETAYVGGLDNYIINVSIIVPPSLSAWMEERDEKKVAVCRAERGRPAANISWTFTSNCSVKTEVDLDGLITVESSVEIMNDMNEDNISCTINHAYWNEMQTFVPKLIKSQSTGHYNSMVYVTIVFSVVFCLGLLFLGTKKLKDLRICHKSSSKSSTIEDVEEVEPYASYVQRVNSIYNSS